ncbi:tetratricopeptide repeat protein [Microvirga massiliensis]|uniref:tetratricopeptide repeat protein n=1 Tax=Microvirga massiliensis TaxID=1033741 RepID=UPI00062BF06B|nr:tetratricopeptide repeat protein [Microvirga massiliensis]
MRLFASSFLAAALMSSGALAQAVPAPETAGPKAEAPDNPARSSLEDLFDRLGKATDETEAQGIARLIERRWGRSGSDTADLLMSRATEAMHRKDYPLAVELLDRVLVLQPGWAEAWYRRANVFYMLDDPVSAIADIREAVHLEPRHFGAWTGLGHILMSSDDKTRALEAYRRALTIYPQLSTVQDLVKRLAPEVDGLDL